ncbi:MAG TPA: hypothetical protein VK302_00295 [Terriglobales bacterium]|nr:hypothetical protein [Terriglobales bacterium]
MIAEKQRQIELYQAMIVEWQRELGEPVVGAIATTAAANGSEKSAIDDPVAGVKKYQFFGKSQPEAAKMLLEFVTHPLLTEEIVDGLEKGGVTVGGKTPKDKKTNLYTILQRSGDFVRFKKGTWGLPNWPGAPKKEEQEKEENEKASA